MSTANSTIDQQPAATEAPLPECLTRDHLTGPYFPNTSLATMVAVIVLGLIFMFTGFNRLNHTDLWGHLNFGRWMATNHALPAADPFAADPAATPVLQAAWLSQWLGYETQQLFGNEGLALAHALLVTMTAGILMLAAYRRGAPAIWAWSAGAAMVVLDLPIVGTVRPQLFGQLGAALFLLACVELPHRKHPLIWLPIVAMLWANLHGSILMGLAILGIYAVGVTWNLIQEHGQKAALVIRDRRFLVVWAALLLALAGACVNPHGPALLSRIAFFGEHAALSSIMEWRALTPGSLTGMLMIASGGLTVLIFKTSPRKWELHEVLLLLVFGLATIPAIRMLAWWAVVWPWVAIPHAAAAWRKYQEKSTGQRISDQDQPTSMRTVLAMGFVFMTAIVAPPSFSFVTGISRGDAQILCTDTPLYVADEAVRRNLSGAIATPMDWADYLTWKTDGRLKPLVHSHVHLTEEQTWKDYEALYRGDESWLQTLHQHHMQYLLVARQRYPALSKLVLVEDRSGPGRVRIIYQDQRCILAEVLPPQVAKKTDSPVPLPKKSPAL
jgi:hypothetical protein